jgi:hypothetical protein
VREADHPGIELLSGIDPVRAQSRPVGVAVGSPGQLVGRALRGQVVALADFDRGRPVPVSSAGRAK